MKLNFKNLVYNLVVALMTVFILTPVFGQTAALAVGGGLLAVSALLPAAPAGYQPANLAFMAVQKEIWVDDIANNVFPDNTFVSKSRDDSAFLEGKVVHLPQAGATPNTQINRATLPAQASKRVDSDVTYTVDELTTDPVVLTMTEEIEASYDKRSSILADHIDTLITATTDITAFNWSPSLSTSIISTTGASRPVYKASQTGTRKAMTKADLLNASRVLNGQNVPQEGRCCLIDSDLLMDLMLIPEFTQAYAIGSAANITDGSIAKVLGFTFFVRSNTTLYTGAGAKRNPNTAAAATDNVSALFWHPNFVRRACGTKANGGVQVFEDAANPLYYGDVFSAMVRFGGRIARNDQRGVVAVIEAAG